MRRRDFLKLIGSAAAAWPRAARAQQAAMALVGFLNGQAAAGFTHLVAAFRQGLAETGYVEGRGGCRWCGCRLRIDLATLDGAASRAIAIRACSRRIATEGAVSYAGSTSY